MKGHKYIITELYDNPLPEIDNTLYLNLIKYLLAKELSTKPDYTCKYSKTNLFYILGMINNEYSRLKKNFKSVEEELPSISKWQIYNFWQRSDIKLTNVLFSALNSMAKSSLIIYESIYVIVTKRSCPSADGSFLDYREATDSEKKMILTAEKQVLDEMGLDSKPFFQMQKFYNKLNEKLYERYNWEYVYRELKIIYNQEPMKKALARIKDTLDDELQKRKLKLNENLIDALNRQAEFNLEKNRKMVAEENERIFQSELNDEDVWDADGKNVLGQFVYPEGYVNNQEELARLFIDIKN